MDNHVVEFELNRRIAWEPAPDGGHPRRVPVAWGHRWRFELAPDGPDATVVTETYDARVPRRPSARPTGDGLARAMTTTLARLEGAADEGARIDVGAPRQ